MEFYLSTFRDEDRVSTFGAASKRESSVFEGCAGVCFKVGKGGAL